MRFMKILFSTKFCKLCLNIHYDIQSRKYATTFWQLHRSFSYKQINKTESPYDVLLLLNYLKSVKVLLH